MSQEYFPGKGTSAGEGSSRHPPEDVTENNPLYPRPPPTYMTVGNGSTSESATALMATLNADSGYGGSIASGSVMDGDEGAGWRADLMVDRPTPIPTPPGSGNWNPAGS
jgi:mitofusin